MFSFELIYRMISCISVKLIETRLALVLGSVGYALLQKELQGQAPFG